MSSSLQAWQNIPDGSTLKVSLESAGDYVGDATCTTIGGPVEQWSHGEMDPGPKTKKLDSPHDYSTRVDVGFVKPEAVSVTVTARIVKPDGTQQSSTYTHAVSGTNGETAAVDIIAKTVK